MIRLLLLSLIVAAMFAKVSAQESKSKPQFSSAGADVHAKDRAAIRETMNSFAKSFQSKDAKQLAAHWTPEGELQTVSGVTITGREALEQRFSKFFAVTPEVQAEVQSQSLRFLSKDSAFDEGKVTIRKGPAGPPIRAVYRAFFVRNDNRWNLASLTESAATDTSISDLGWLIGEWKSTSSESAEIQTTYTWDANKKFIHAKFVIKETERTLSGLQVIGVDPETGTIHSWTFEANGGIGEADWLLDGDHWVLDAEGTLPDGAALIQTNILSRVNNDTFTWQSTNRLLDGNAIPDLAPVKVTRIISKQ